MVAAYHHYKVTFKFVLVKTDSSFCNKGINYQLKWEKLDHDNQIRKSLSSLRQVYYICLFFCSFDF